MKTGIELIKEERNRQGTIENYRDEHNDECNDKCQLAIASSVYILDYVDRTVDWHGIIPVFPWDNKYYKPTIEDPIRQLTKAGALIAAEIDRLQRIKNKDK
jgi:hypothetical protein